MKFITFVTKKVVSDKKITLVKVNCFVKNDKNAATVSNNFFYNIINNLGITQYNETESLSLSIGDPHMKAIIKDRSHLSKK